VRRSLGEIAARLDVHPSGDPARVVTGVAIDSRAVRAGDLFVALPGAHVDGHAFVGDAAARGAVAALVAHPVANPLPQLVVVDPLAALQRLATRERAEASYRLAAVTGSIGKTTTKEFLAALLATTFAVGATAGSRNSQAGFPAELCSQPDGIAWMVAELGMSHAGELDRLGAIAQPDALLYTVVAPVHLEFFASVDAIAEAKAELIPHLHRDGVLVLNAADARGIGFGARFAGRVLRYGSDVGDLAIAGYTSRGLLGASFTLTGALGTAAISWSIAGRHQADNLLAAATLALALGVPPHALAPIAAQLRPARRRGEIHRLPDGITVVDDSYNSSPEAAARLLALLAETPGRRVAVLGEMLELGASSPTMHRDVGALAARSADVVVAVGGDNAAELAHAAGTSARLAPDAEAALGLVRGIVRPGDVVLVKGSRGIGLDRVVDRLLAGRG
jgi:UDP-N-acetylmuramoyl-tripeptide--D-alanyl-D-alanine ligase